LKVESGKLRVESGEDRMYGMRLGSNAWMSSTPELSHVVEKYR
jgi:hypothetical protein